MWERIRQIMEIKHTITNYIVTEQLLWFWHIQKIDMKWICKQMQLWQLQCKWKPHRSRRPWIEDVGEGIKEKDIEEGLSNDKKEWRREIGKRWKVSVLTFVSKLVKCSLYYFDWRNKFTRVGQQARFPSP